MAFSACQNRAPEGTRGEGPGQDLSGSRPVFPTERAIIEAERLRKLRIARAAFLHHHLVSACVVLDPGHVVAHQHDSATARDVEVFVLGGVWDLVWAESRAFVGDLDSELVGAELAESDNLLGLVLAVAMPNRVDQGFFQRQVNAEDLLGFPLVLLEFLEHLLQEWFVGAQLAGKSILERPSPRITMHRKSNESGERSIVTKEIRHIN